MAWKRDDEIKCEIVKVYGYLNDKETKAVVKVKWGDSDPKVDIRSVFKKDGELRLGKGISLNDDELEMLKEILEKEVEHGVDFDDIFRQAESITKNRSKGYATSEGGFIKLTHKKR